MNTSDSTTDAVVLERSFAAPIGEMWQMWTDPAAFASWYGPAGAQVPVCDVDVRVGGRRRVCMRFDTPDGTREMWFTGEFLEVTEPNRLVYTEAMTDADGAPMPGGHPSTEVCVEFEETGDATRVVLTHRGIPSGSPGEAGWRAFDELDRQLSSR
ncbi:MAG: SRPBCC domain-containing protein [Ilumatobacteraceae bacterium]